MFFFTFGTREASWVAAIKLGIVIAATTPIMPRVIRTSARVNAHFLIMSLTASIAKGRTLSPSPSSLGEGNSPMRSDRDSSLAITGIFRTCSVKHFTLSLASRRGYFAVHPARQPETSSE